MKRTILVVDDNSINRQILNSFLCEEYNVVQAEDGESALKVLSASGDGISAVILDLTMPVMDGYQVLESMKSQEELSGIPVIVNTGSSDTETEKKALSMGANDFVTKPFEAEIIKHRLHNLIRLRETAAMVNTLQHDELTGLLIRNVFFKRAGEMIDVRPAGYYTMASFDVDNFKVINDQYGVEKGDEVLKKLGLLFKSGFDNEGGLCCRVTADNFAVVFPSSFLNSPKLAEIRNKAANLDGFIQPITFSVGHYIIDDLTLPVSGMYDRAVLAQTSVKGRYDGNVGIYDESMRSCLLRKQAIISEMKSALEQRQFEAWFQPQYNHSTGALIGAEALARWRHPTRGLIPPGEFIPIFEENGFVYELDKYIWQETCAYLRKWLDEGLMPLPVSVNISRCDVFREDIVAVLEGLLDKYSIPVELLRLEITESAFASSTDRIIAVVRQLVDKGFTMEIDDFGSGYSSLNTLKDVPAQIVKLDMRFLDNNENSDRGGNIISSVVRMVKWLGMTLIAEGVETQEQANFLRSIGCSYVQGYLYARPMPAADYEALAASAEKEEKLVTIETVERLDNNSFWSPDSMNTLIFNSYVGGACIFEYHNGETELLRVNEKYAKELSGNEMTVQEALKIKISDYMDEQSREKMHSCIKKALELGGEYAYEIRLVNFNNEGRNLYIHSAIRVIARAGDHYLIYCSIINTTDRHEAEAKERAADRRLSAIIANIDGGVSAATVSGDDVTFIFTNDKYYSILGYTREQFHTELKSAYDVVCDEDREGIQTVIHNVIQTRKPDSYQYRCKKRSGEIIWLKCSVTVTDLEGIAGEVLLSVIHDVTREKEAEDIIIRSAQQLRFLSDTAHDFLAATDVTTAINCALGRALDYFNGERAYIVECDDEKRVSNNTYEVCAPGVTSEIANLQQLPYEATPYVWKCFETDKFISFTDIAKLTSGDEETKRLLASQGIHSLIAAPLWHAGKLMGFIGVDNPARQQSTGEQLGALADNITGILIRRDLMAKIQSDSRELRELMNDTPGGFARMRVKADGSVMTEYVNETFSRIRHMTVKEILDADSGDSLNSVHPDDGELMKTTAAQMVATGKTCVVNYRLKTSLGTYVPVRAVGRATKNEAGEIFVNAYYTELADEERQELSQSELIPAALSAMMESSENLVFCKDVNLKYVRVSAKVADFLGLPLEKILRKTACDILGSEFAEKSERIERDVINTGVPALNIEEIIPVGGSVCCVRISKYPLRDSMGNIIGLFGVGSDITDSRIALQQLKLLTESISVGLATYTLEGDKLKITYFNDGQCKIFGVTREEYERLTTQNVITAVFEQDVPALKAQIANMITNRVPVDCTYRIHTPGDGYKWVNLRASPEQWQDSTRYAHAVLFDVTRQKLAEEAICFREREYSLAIAQSGRLIYRYSHVDKQIDVPRDTARLLGLPEKIGEIPESVIRLGVIAPESIDDYVSFYRSLLNGEQKGAAKVKRLINGDQWHWFEINFSTVFNDEDKPFSAIVVLEDITQQIEEQAAGSLDRSRFIAALGTVYPLLISVNLTGNFYHIVADGGILSKSEAREGRLNELIAAGISHMEPEYADRFKQKYGNDKLLNMFDVIGDSIRLEYNRLSGDEQHWLEVLAIRTSNQFNDDIIGVVVCRYIDAQKAMETKLRLAERDGMTGLYNKVTMEELVSRRLKDNSEAVALMVADLDDLKSINDSMGHGEGDRALKTMADILRTQFRKEDIVGRIGGDEFSVFISGVTESRLRNTMTAFMRRLSAEHIGENNDYPLHGSVGIAMAQGEIGYDELFRMADKALYHVKRNGKDDFVFYTPEMEMDDYSYIGHSQESRWQAGYYNICEMESLLQAVATVYPVVVSINLTQNSYSMLKYGQYHKKQGLAAGCYDDLINETTKTYHPKDRGGFAAIFNRKKLLVEQGWGVKTVGFTGREMGDDGLYRLIHTDAIFVKSNDTGDILQITLVREAKNAGMGETENE